MRSITGILIACLVCLLPILSIAQESGQSKTFAITATSEKHGTIAPSGAVNITEGGIQSFSIKPNEGYHIESLHIDGSVIDHDTLYTFSNVSANHTISARFASNERANSSAAAPESVTIYAQASEQGAISPSGAVKVRYGENQEFRIDCDARYHIDSLLVDSSLVQSDNTYSFMNVTANHSIIVSFAKNNYTITAECGSNGTITPAGKITLRQGDYQSFAIVPAAGYHIDKVIVDGVDRGVVESYTFTNIGAAHSIRAEFAKDN
jgi:hypothetical protein